MLSLLLSGDSGLRREEITGAARAGMRESTYSSDDSPVWELTVVGKRKIERTVAHDSESPMDVILFSRFSDG